MADEETELRAAKAKIVDLEKQLEEAKTPKQEDKVEDKLEKQLARLEALEQKHKPTKPDPEIEDEDEDGDQCPVCGEVLEYFGDGTYHCSGCGEYFEEE